MSASAPEHDTPPAASVFDFLYYDARRVGSILAQLSGDGVLQGFKRTTGTGSVERVDHQMSGSVNVVVARGQAGSTDSNTTEAREGIERHYDPFWSNACDLLDLLDAAGLLQRDLATARIGQPMLIGGSLMLLDMAMLREVWKRPAIRKLLLSSQAPAAPQNRAARRSADRQPTMPGETEVALDLIDLLPHTVQGWILSASNEVFFTLQPDALVTPPGDLMLKHGIHLGDNWSVLGILDALPGPLTESQIVDMTRVSTGSSLNEVITNLALPIRQLMGRPSSAHAITPLAIFREVIKTPATG